MVKRYDWRAKGMVEKDVGHYAPASELESLERERDALMEALQKMYNNKVYSTGIPHKILAEVEALLAKEST